MDPAALIVEDHPLYRDALVRLMQAIMDPSCVLAATSVEHGMRVAAGRTISVILLDLGLPGINGVEGIRAYQRSHPGVPIMVVSASEDRQQSTAALRAGAKIVMSKAVSTEAMQEAVLRVLGGQVATPEWITFQGQVSAKNSDLKKLTPRQTATLELLLQGHSNKEIGLRLGLAEITVKIHVSALFKVLGVVNRTQAVLAARRLGLCIESADLPTPGTPE